MNDALIEKVKEIVISSILNNGWAELALCMIQQLKKSKLFFQAF